MVRAAAKTSAGLTGAESAGGANVSDCRGDDWSSVRASQDGDWWFRSPSRLWVCRKGSRKAQSWSHGIPDANLAPSRLVNLPGGALGVPTEEGLALIVDSWFRIIRPGHGLANESVSSVIVDREGSVWIAVRGLGLLRWLGYGQWEAWDASRGPA